jgi:serpin B
MKNILKLLGSPVMIYFTVRCSTSDNESNYPDLPDANPIVLKSGFENKLKQDNAFAFDLFKTICLSSEAKPTIFISPLSVSMALNMTLNGAFNETRDEMEQTLRINGYSSDDINEYSKVLRNALIQVDPSTQISIANSIWYPLGFYVENSFIQTNRTYFNAEVNELDFSYPNAIDQINRWCANNTNNKITEIVDQLDAIFYVINAFYFKGIWKHKFEKANTRSEDFYSANGLTKKVRMMQQTETFTYYSDETMSSIELPYGNKAFSMIVMLPNEDKTISDITDKLTGESWDNMQTRMYSTKVNIHLPRFKVEYKCGLHKGILQEMGMKSAFLPSADFRGINKNRDLYIGQVIHKTYIEVNEEGTEAAAVTSVGVFSSVGPSQPVDFIVNKPFLYVIKEKSTGVILFIGKIEEINQ